ncbi:MAG: hypothetical protein DRM98_00015 [Thermoplasmata archaeon]|nr:MAG: hypothetical protein DRM98_00015 [Thermoplasmata archaeon]
MDFIWKHKEGDKETELLFPIKIYKAVDNGWRPETHLICNKCDGRVSQKYICENCKAEYTIGEIEKRHDVEHDVIYNIHDYKAYMESEIPKSVKVEEEIPVTDIIPNILFIKNIHEIYNNDDNYADVVLKIYNYLKKKQIALVVSFGKSQKQRGGIIVATDRLVLLELRDYRLIRHVKQSNIVAEENNSTQILKAVSESQEPQIYGKFVEAVVKGEKIEVKEKVKKEKVIVNADFLEV